MKIFSTYKTVDTPWGGANSFLRAMKEEMVTVYGVEFVEEPEAADIIFMNQSTAGPGNDSHIYSFSEAQAFKARNPSAKLIVRAVNLESHAYPVGFFKYYLGKGYKKDKDILNILHLADFVIFQSHYQKSFFEKGGYHGKNFTVIHNGASKNFSGVNERVSLSEQDTLTVLSSSAAKRNTKRHDLVAAISLQPGVKVYHAGGWPEKTPVANVELCGTLDHAALRALMQKCHYFLHPASKDPCPNSLIEGLREGLPALYNAGEGTGEELAGQYGIPIEENNISGMLSKARQKYDELTEKLHSAREEFGIKRAAADYYKVFARVCGDNHG